MSNNYAAIILDIQHSRTYDDEQRFYIQDKLFSIIQFINEYYSKELVKSFEFSSGDSIQALFKDVSEINVKLGKTEKATKVKKDKKNEKEAEEK